MSKECVRLVDCEFYLNDSGLSIHSKNPNFQTYINYFLLSDMCQEYIYRNCTSGSIQKNINMNLFYKLKIPIPINKDKMQEWTNKISTPYNEKNEKLYKQYIQEMVQDAIPSQINNMDTHTIPLIENFIEIPDEIEIVPKKKVIKKIAKKAKLIIEE